MFHFEFSKDEMLKLICKLKDSNILFLIIIVFIIKLQLARKI